MIMGIRDSGRSFLGLGGFLVIFSCLVVSTIGGRQIGHHHYHEDLSSSSSNENTMQRNHNGVMKMTLSPQHHRKTVLSLGRSLSGGSSGSVNPRHKPTVIFARAENKGELFENQSATKKSSSASDVGGGGASDLFNSLLLTDDNEDVNSGGGSIRRKNHEELMMMAIQPPNSEEMYSSSIADVDNAAVDNGNENESQLVEQSPLRNISQSSSSSSSSSSSNNNRLSAEFDGINNGVDVSSEENDFHAMIAGFLKREIWTIPLFVFASLNIVLITFFEIYVLCRTKGQSRGHLFLGQMLLFALFLASTLALLFALYPSTIGCFISRVGVGLSYSLIFSVLLVKCVFLLSLDVGVYLPTTYQVCLLFFAVLVQFALDTQWLILSPPFFQETEMIKEESLFIQCGTSYSQLLYSLSYVVFLNLLVGFMAAKATFQGITENYRESIYIFMSIVVSVPISVSWILAGWILEGRHQDACVAFGLVAQSLAVFLIMFMPKGRQLAALGKECAYEEDDQFSRYSPSFFHFKPSNSKICKTAVFGDGNLYTTLEPTLSTINPNVFFHRADYNSGMIY